MRVKKTGKKFPLNKLTVANLDAPALMHLKGGATTNLECTYTCEYIVTVTYQESLCPGCETPQSIKDPMLPTE